jgi:hypothetical protein
MTETDQGGPKTYGFASKSLLSKAYAGIQLMKTFAFRLNRQGCRLFWMHYTILRSRQGKEQTFKNKKYFLPWNLLADGDSEGLTLLLSSKIQDRPRSFLAHLPGLVPTLLVRFFPALLPRLVPTLLPGLVPALLPGLVPTFLSRLVPAFAVLVAFLLDDGGALLLRDCLALLLAERGALFLGEGHTLLLVDGLALLVEDRGALLFSLGLGHRHLHPSALLLHLLHTLLVQDGAAFLLWLVPTLLLRLVPAFELRHCRHLRLQHSGAVTPGDLGAVLLGEGGAVLPGHQVLHRVHQRLAHLLVGGGALLVVGERGDGLLDVVADGLGLVPALHGEDGLAGGGGDAGEGVPGQGQAYQEYQGLQNKIKLTLNPSPQGRYVRNFVDFKSGMWRAVSSLTIICARLI